MLKNFLDINEVLKITSEGKDKRMQGVHEKCNILIDHLMEKVLLKAEQGEDSYEVNHKDIFPSLKYGEVREIFRITNKHLNTETLFRCDYHSEKEGWEFIISWRERDIKQKIEEMEYEKAEKIRIKNEEKLRDEAMALSFKTIIPDLLVKDNLGNKYIRTFDYDSKNIVVKLINTSGFSGYKKGKFYSVYIGEHDRKYIATQDGKTIRTDYIVDSEYKQFKFFRKIGE